MKLTIEHLAAYLPYEVKCQYTGIINSKELSAQKKQLRSDDFFAVNFKPINEVYGLKIAPLKSIICYKKYWVAKCGIFTGGLKSFYCGDYLKLCLRPLSDLTKEIEHNGERFVPASKMITHGFHHEFWNEDKFDYRYLYALDYQKLLSWHFNIFKLPETLYVKYSDIE